MSAPNAPQEQLVANQNEYPSLCLAYDLVKDRLADQRAWADALDTKAGAVIAAASVVMGLAVAFQAAIPIDHGLAASQKLARALLLVPQFLTYFGTGWTSYQAYAVKKHKYVPTPTQIWAYVRNDEQFTRVRLLVAMKCAHEINAKQIEDKAKWLRWSLWAFIAQTAVLGASVFVEILVS